MTVYHKGNQFNDTEEKLILEEIIKDKLKEKDQKSIEESEVIKEIDRILKESSDNYRKAFDYLENNAILLKNHLVKVIQIHMMSNIKRLIFDRKMYDNGGAGWNLSKNTPNDKTNTNISIDKPTYTLAAVIYPEKVNNYGEIKTYFSVDPSGNINSNDDFFLNKMFLVEDNTIENLFLEIEIFTPISSFKGYITTGSLGKLDMNDIAYNARKQVGILSLSNVYHIKDKNVDDRKLFIAVSDINQKYCVSLVASGVNNLDPIPVIMNVTPHVIISNNRSNDFDMNKSFIPNIELSDLSYIRGFGDLTINGYGPIDVNFIPNPDITIDSATTEINERPPYFGPNSASFPIVTHQEKEEKKSYHIVYTTNEVENVEGSAFDTYNDLEGSNLYEKLLNLTGSVMKKIKANGFIIYKNNIIIVDGIQLDGNSKTVEFFFSPYSPSVSDRINESHLKTRPSLRIDFNNESDIEDVQSLIQIRNSGLYSERYNKLKYFDLLLIVE
jgi:hypothetical protein